MKLRPFVVTAAAFVALSVAPVMKANASSITIHDLTDVVSVTTDGNPAAIQILPDSIGEFLHFNYTSTRVNTAGTSTFVAEIFETDQITPSDWFVITATNNSAVLNVSFYSDPATFPLLQPIQTFVETGLPQLMVQYFGGSATPIDSFFVESDINDRGPDVVPEPTSMLLLGTGLAGLSVRRWRKRRNA